MTYAVVWLNDAISAVVEILARAADPNAVAAAMEKVRTILSVDRELPDTPLHEGLRSINVPPLRVLYSIDHEKRVVEIVAVRLLDA